MKYIVLSIILMWTTNIVGDELTNKDVQSLISKVELIVKKQDANELGKFLKDDIKIVMNMESNGNKQTIKVEKSKYLSMLKEGWSVCSNHRYKISDIDIKIENEIAHVSSTVKETMTCQNQNVSGISYEKTKIQLIDDKLKITEIIANIKM